MKISIIAAVLAATVGYAQARPEYDVKLEAAAARIVAEKMGAIRGGFSINQKPEMVRAIARADRLRD